MRVGDDQQQPPPPRDDGDADVENWGTELSDIEIDEETLRAEWLAGEEASRGRRTKATVTIASCNMKGRGEVNHLDRPSTNNKWMQINQVMRERKLGVLALQETHMVDELDAKISSLFSKRLKVIHSKDEDSPNAKGVSIVINRELLDAENVRSVDVIAGRALMANVPWHNDERLTILAVYAPNRPDDNRDFWNQILERWEDLRLPKPDILMGDFNFVESFIDRLPAHEDRPETVLAFDRLKSRMKLADGWRLLNPGARNYTYMQKQSEGQPQSRIDRIYASNRIIKNSQEWNITPTGGIQTDHWMVSVRILSDNTPFQGPGRWSLPLYLLRDRHLKTEVTNMARKLEEDIERCTYRRTTERNPQTLYKTFKCELKEAGRQRAKETIPAMKREIEELTEQRRVLANDPKLKPVDKRDATIEITERINDLEESRHTSARLSTAARDALEGERITKYWSAVNATAKKKEPIRNLQRPGGHGLETRSDKMAEIARNHHDGIQRDGLGEDQEAREESIRVSQSKVESKLDNQQKAEMAQRIRESEVIGAIRAAPPGKAAGLDGIPAELWREMAHDYDEAEKKEPRPSPMPPNIAKILTKVYNDIEEHGIEPGTEFNEGWMCPIFKKSERSEIANYRPITVLNTDYKIMTKAITTRLTGVIDSLIDTDQAGFIPKRSIFDQVKLAKLVLKHSEATEYNGAIVALDQEKAYDKIAHDYLWRILIAFNMPQNFINTVKRLYTNAHTSVMINGVLSQSFKIIRGVRQGDPLSCLLFNLAIEPLACAIRQSNLKGLKVPGQDKRLIVKLFADDTTVYLSSDDDLNHLHDILTNWCTASRAKFNITKTEVIPIGSPGYRSWVHHARKLHGTHGAVRESMRFNRDGEPVRILGAWIGNKIDNAVPWAPVVEKIERALDRWDRGHPTLEGRRLIVQMIVGGTTQYLAKVQEMPERITKKLTDMIWEFIWEGNQRSAPVNREVMHAQLLEGGKKILDLQARNEAIQLTWLQSYMSTTNRPTWAYFADALFQMAAPISGRQIDETAASNPFLQSWRPRTATNSPLPKELASMVKTAEKHGVKLDAIAIGREVKLTMPVWFHIEESPYMKQVTNRPAARCLRETHGIRTVHQLSASTTEHEGNHNGRPACECTTCRKWRDAGCRHPHQCRELGKRILSSLPTKWDPEKQDNNLDRILSEEENANNERALENGHDVIFERRLTANEIADTIRVFAPKKDRTGNQPEDMIRDQNRPTTDTWILSKSRLDATGETRTAAAVWFGPGDDRNYSFRVGGKQASRQKGEIMAIAEALKRAPPDIPLRVLCQSKQNIEKMTSKLRILEDKGWSNTKHGDELRAAASWARKRKAKTYFKLAKNTRDSQLEAGIRAEVERCLNHDADEIDTIQMTKDYDNGGAKLSEMSQADMYRCIIERKRQNATRRRTETMINKTKAALLAANGRIPEQEEIWKSMRNKDFSRSQRTFKWKAMHGAYKIGAYWRNIPNYEERAICPQCQVEENMEHILLECDSTARKAIKNAEKELWQTRTNVPFPEENIGIRLGAALVQLSNKRGSQDSQGLERFWRIVQSETDQTIWNIRCEARIARGDRLEERHTEAEAVNRWRSAIERRLNIERITADAKRFGKLAIDRDIVMATWDSVIERHGEDDNGWIEHGGVLVGRRQDGPPGRNR
jgi:exonuclease III